MTNSLNDILAGRKYDEPPEIKAIKDYVDKQFGAEVAITLRAKHVIINVPSAALAGALRMHTYKINQLCGLDKRIVIRISG